MRGGARQPQFLHLAANHALTLLTHCMAAAHVTTGSHMSGMSEVPDGWEPPLVVQPSAPAGSVLVYNGHCWHAGGANTSDIDRCSCFGHYRKSLEAYPAFGGRIFQCDPAAGFPADWWDDLTQRQKELMGMTAGPGGPPAGQLTAHDHSSCHFLSFSLSLSPSLARSVCVLCLCLCLCVCVLCVCVCTLVK